MTFNAGTTTMRLNAGSLGKLLSFRQHASGSVATMTALSLPVLVGASFVAIEISQAVSQRTQMQEMADGAAVAAARELRLGNATPEIVIGVAKNFIDGASAGRGLSVNFESAVSPDKKSITVNLNAGSTTGFAAALGLLPPALAVTAVAKVMGGAPVCGVILNGTDNDSLYLEKQARMEAPQCSLYSNSKHATGVEAKDSATIKAAFICTAGGYKGGTGSFTPSPETDCPAFPDPLASRPAPAFGGCDLAKQNLVVSGTGVYLTPGVYCGGLKIDKDTQVTLQPGIYIIKDGPLALDKNVQLSGTGVGLFFTGDKSGMTLNKETTISLTAPKSGPMAGLLVYQDRSASKDDVKFEISSDDAGMLLGTIYLPRGHLFLGGDKPVAQKSAYTIVVANKIQASAGPTLVLNSDYALSDVPVPAGLGPLSTNVRLE